MDLVTEHPQLNLFDSDWAIRGLPTQPMPTKFFYKDECGHTLDNSLISGGCLITNTTITESVLFDRIHVDENSRIDHAVILPEVTIGKNCTLSHCIIERKCVIPDDFVIGVDKEMDRARGFRISNSGKVTLVTPAMLDALKSSQS